MKHVPHYIDGRLVLCGHKLEDIALSHGTPCYVYSAPRIVKNYQSLRQALTQKIYGHDHLICYAVKANSHLAVLNIIAKQGGGADVVSAGELHRCLKAGIAAEKIVFSGVGKTEAEIEFALNSKILQINVESIPELERINRIAQKLGIKAPVGLRINPDVDGGEHDKTSTGRKEDKFGIAYNEAFTAYGTAFGMSHINVTGISVHIGSQIIDTTPFALAYKKIADFLMQMEKQGQTLKNIDLGGGMGITYTNEKPLDPLAYADIVYKTFGHFKKTCFIFEPGRAITGDAGLLLARVEYIKTTPEGRSFVILDTGMGELMRPALYGAYHPVLPCRDLVAEGRPVETFDIVGPICESSDIFIKNLHAPIMKEGDYVAITVSGAYGMSMASSYNSRALPLEIMLDETHINVITPRMDLQKLSATEKIPDWI